VGLSGEEGNGVLWLEMAKKYLENM